MIKAIRLVFLVLLVTTVSGCAPKSKVVSVDAGYDQPTKEELEVLYQLIKQSREEVIEKLGLPDKHLVLDDRHYLIYLSEVDKYSRPVELIFPAPPIPIPIPVPKDKSKSGSAIQCLILEIDSDNLVDRYNFEYIDSFELTTKCLENHLSESELKNAIQVSTLITIDIKPNDDSNVVNPDSREVISVAILNLGNFVDSSVDPSTVTFGPTKAIPTTDSTLDDVNGDGVVDEIYHFKIEETGIACGDFESTLTGKTYGGTPITGADILTTVGCD